jgi:hypothetical protein
MMGRVKRYLLSSFIFSCTFSLLSLEAAGYGTSQGLGSFSVSDPKLEINNRVLIKINGAAITVMDVVRKMDMVFFQQFPNFLNEPGLRYQFYKENWRHFLEKAIDDKLMLADAEEKKIKVTEGEVREQLQETLGPNLVFNLEAIGMTLDEAIDMVKTDMIVRRMKGGMVQAKALAEVNPRKIREQYEKNLIARPPLAHYCYQVLSFKAPMENAALSAASKTQQLLQNQTVSLDLIKEQFSEPDCALNCSDPYTRSEKDISTTHKAVLDLMKQGEYSPPFVKKGVAYVLHLKEKQEGKAPAFGEEVPKIRQQLLEESIAKYDAEYRQRLRKSYGLTEQFISQLIPEETQPFALR